MIKRFLLLPIFLALLTACSASKAPLTATQVQVPTALPTSQSTDTSLPLTSTPVPTASASQVPADFATPVPTASSSPLPTPTATLAADAWMDLPIVPAEISQQVRDIYARGLALGNNPNAFSKIGDCDTSSSWFLGDFDLGPKYYHLGAYTDLQGVIDQFHGSYERESLAARRGFVAASVLSPFWSDPAKCQAKETPLSCELRLNRPAYAFILLGTNDYNHRQEFEPNMRKILDALFAQGVVPILATKADDMEGDNSINDTLARLAYEYGLPLWNFWRAVQPLPARGLQADQSHLTFAANLFDNPKNMQAAWPWRNLTALQTLDAVWRGVTAQP